VNRIHVLDEATISKIAAGEVIERPASVVKELVENSLDAGATEIRVRILDAGKTLIEVVDDGCGIGPDDLKLAFIQHATSKITGIDDLENLETMGFRGEALSSIASVAEVEVSTREKNASTGIHVKLVKGHITESKQVGRTQGTTIAVRNLFSGHPARLKYLKSDSVEMGHIIQVMTERALANPEIAFKLHNGDVEVLNLPRSKTIADRIGDVMGRRIARELVVIDSSAEGAHVLGHLAKPSITKATRSELYIFVNFRPVSSSAISEAVEKGYAGMLMRNRHPVGVLMLVIDPSIIDVNVHPTKRKVRFENEKAIASMISKVVAEVMGNIQHIPEVSSKQREFFPVEPTAQNVPASHPGETKKPVQQPKPVAEQSALSQELGETVEIAESQTLPRMKVIGQVMDTYIIAQSGPDIMIIDQHAVHERIMLDRLRNRPKKKSTQNLITPILLNLGKRESQLVEHYRPVIEDLGFKIEPFGKDTYMVRAVPAIGGHIETESGLLDLINELAELGKAKSIQEKRDEIQHLVACHSAIRAGEKLSSQRMALLIEEMHGLENPFTCAHGRPTIVKITKSELERMFKRVV
jgi:DNA mismatch repair protein MutL